MYAIQGGASGELLTLWGKVIVHDNVQELKFLFPKHDKFVEVKLNGATMQDGRPAMQLRDHPDMETVRWPLKAEDFVPLRGATRRQEAEVIIAAMRKDQ